MANWGVGSLLAWPIAAEVGRRFKASRAGVPIVPLNRWVHDFPRPEPGRVARLTFRFYSVTACLMLGYIFARQVTDYTVRTQNQWYNRPDLKPFPAMVKQPGDDELTHRTMEQAQYFSKAGDDFKSSSLFRFFMARDADFEIKQNPYANRHPEDVWNSATGQYATYHNNFGRHHQ